MNNTENKQMVSSGAGVNGYHISTNHFPMYSSTCNKCGITENSMNKFEIIVKNDLYEQDVNEYNRIKQELGNKLYETKERNNISLNIFNEIKELAEIEVFKHNTNSIFKEKFVCDKINRVVVFATYPWEKIYFDRIITYTIYNWWGKIITNEQYTHLSEDLKIGRSIPNISDYKYLICSTCGYYKKI